MRIVTRNLSAFDADVLRMLPALIKTQMLQQITRRQLDNGLGFVATTTTTSTTTDTSIPNNTTTSSSSTVHLLRALLHRELGQLDLSAVAGGLTADELHAIVAAAPNLRELKLSGAVRLSDSDDVLDALSRLPFLRALYVAAVPAMDNDVMRMLAARCPSLEVLDVSRCERVGDGCASVVRGMRLRKLNVSYTAVSGVVVMT